MSSLAGKAVIVTGSNSGIGLATACLFAKQGAHVTVCGRDEGRLREALQACEKARDDAKHKGKVISVRGDLTDPAVMKETVDKTVEAFGQLDVLVANHGVIVANGNESLETWTQECFDVTMKTNVSSVVQLIQLAVPHLEKVRGNVVCVSSLGSMTALTGPFNYLVSKAALDHAVRCLALQLGPRGIRINTTNPTAVVTRLARDLPPEVQAIALSNPVLDREQPLQGQASTVDAQADVIVFLASDAARLVHGQCIVVDGGLGLKGNPFNYPTLFEDLIPKQ